MSKKRLIISIVFAVLSIAFFIFGTLCLASKNSTSDNDLSGIGLIILVPIGLMCYLGQLVSWIISVICFSKGLKDERKGYRVVSAVFVAVISITIIVSCSIIINLYVSGS